ncbi:hypothetical protein T01_1077 [Trichinella spiralis]|uniref:DUF5641 domain-containing protein n=1 Tax=Trichinella spiralis TaxID=6334 RepID=A0A0V1BUG6_TRISP|nr:hypothetical protein T01_1077 [Trichinella spiralis]
MFQLLRGWLLCQSVKRKALAVDPSNNSVAGSTPAHFLIGRELSRLPSVTMERYRCNDTAKYITTFAPRKKWRKTGQEPRVGDIVLVHEPGTTWSKWLIGRITDIHPSEDGVIRSVTVKTKQGAVTRSARSLRLVESSSDALQSGSHLGGGSGQKISDLSCICHNSGDQLLKKRQSEMWLTAWLFRRGEAAQYKPLHNHPGC